jgi:hypothetical protein
MLKASLPPTVSEFTVKILNLEVTILGGDRGRAHPDDLLALSYRADCYLAKTRNLPDLGLK